MKPGRTANTMSDAIALSSPSGSMSGRSRSNAGQRLFQDLFGNGECLSPRLPRADRREQLLRKAKELRGLAARGMSARKFTREATRLESEARAIEANS